jgi:hypothetical protein
MVNTPKVIFSKTLDAPFGNNTTFASGNLADEISQLKIKQEKIYWYMVVQVSYHLS